MQLGQPAAVQVQMGQVRMVELTALVKDALVQQQQHVSLNMVEIQNADDSSPPDAHAAGIEFATATEQQLSNHLRPDPTAWIVRGRQFIDGHFAAVEDAATTGGADQLRLQRRQIRKQIDLVLGRTC